MNWKTALELGRVSNLPTVWTNTLTGAVLAGARWSYASLAVAALALSSFYVGGMFLNDAFDREIDARERPNRPIPSGRVSARAVFSVGFGLIALGVLTVAVVAHGFNALWQALASAVALAAMIVFYNAHHKGNPWSPFVMGACRALVYVTAGLMLGGSLTFALWLGTAALLGYLIGLTFVAKQETLASFDGAWPLLLLAAPVLIALQHYRDPGVMLAALAVLVWTGYALSFLRPGARFSIPRAVGTFLAGICIVDMLALTTQGSTLALAAALGLPMTLFFHRYVAGT